jgi:PadR family transcriptional regulator, regulatory protein PadR
LAETGGSRAAPAIPCSLAEAFLMAGSDLYTGSLDLLILKAVSWGPLHGYAIGRWIRQSTDEAIAIQEGVLYPALHRLEHKGFLEEEWGVTDTNREAKFYRLSPAGRKQLKREVERWHSHSRIMSAALVAARP